MTRRYPLGDAPPPKSFRATILDLEETIARHRGVASLVDSLSEAKNAIDPGALDGVAGLLSSVTQEPAQVVADRYAAREVTR